MVMHFDDVLETGHSDEDHLENLSRVLQRLKKDGLKLKLDKCMFMDPQVEYLGLFVTPSSHPNPEKTEAL